MKRETPAGAHSNEPSRPDYRVLRAFAFDPSLATELENFDVSEVLVRVRWEPDRTWAKELGPNLREPVLKPRESLDRPGRSCPRRQMRAERVT